MQSFNEVRSKMFFGERIVHSLCKYCDWIARVGVVAMMLIAVGNIIMRAAGKPILGTYDFVSFIGAMLVAFAIAYCAVQKGHIEVELFVARLPERPREIITCITSFFSLGIFSVTTWQCVVLANDMWKHGELSMTALLPFYPYIYGVAFGFALLCLVILVDLIKSLVKAVKR